MKKRGVFLAGMLALSLALSGCGNNAADTSKPETSGTESSGQQESAATEDSGQSQSGADAGENNGQKQGTAHNLPAANRLYGGRYPPLYNNQ